jgi:hypothetical protein
VTNRSRLIYPARRAIEHVVTLPGVRPRRLFAVLWPLWRVEISAHIYDEQQYEVIDRFLLRGLAEAALHRTDELARFFGVQTAMVRRCLEFLRLIGHVQLDGDTVRLTELGRQSLQAGVRYVPKQVRQDLLFERFTERPLPRRYYDGSVTVLDSHRVDPEKVADRTRFRPVFTLAPFRPEVVRKVAALPDRADYNLPRQLRELHAVQCQEAFLPAYLVECADDRLLAYTSASEGRDSFMETICREVAEIRDLVNAEENSDPRSVWREWLADEAPARGTLHRLPNGVWRACFAAVAFADSSRLPLHSLGSFRVRRNHFIQLWCEDRELRQRALLDRSLGMARISDVRTQTDLARRIAPLAELLEIDPPSIADIRAHGRKQQHNGRLAYLDALE